MSTNIKPDRQAMEIFIEHLFDGDLDGHQGGLIELAWTNAKSGKLSDALLFSTDETEKLIDCAVERNSVTGQNVYIGAALRKQDTLRFRRCKDEDFLASTSVWADLDDEAAALGAVSVCENFPPSMIVTTGQVPHLRRQLWWRLEDPMNDPDKLRQLNTSIQKLTGGDPAVVNPSRVMRLAGSIAWPLKPGREVELTSLSSPDSVIPYLPGQIETGISQKETASVTSISAPTDLKFDPEPVKSLQDLLKQITVGNWHEPMRKFTATCVANGFPDWIIIEVARQYLDDPDDPTDVFKLIDGARSKFGIADRSGEFSPDAPMKGVTLGQLINMDLLPRDLIFGEWLAEKGLVMVHAYRGVGKTFFALNVAYAVATGGDYLGWSASKARRVLYLDGEMPAALMQERLGAIRRDKDDGDDNFVLVTPEFQEMGMPDISTLEGQAQIEPLINDIDLVVIDNLSSLCRTGVENEGESWLPVQSWLLDLRRRGKSVLIVHHSGKGNRQRGTSRREDVLDAVIMLSKPNDSEAGEGARFEIHFEKARHFSGQAAKPLEVSMTTDTLGRPMWTVEALEDKDMARVRELTSAGLSVRDIADELKISKSKVNRLQQKAAADL